MSALEKIRKCFCEILKLNGELRGRSAPLFLSSAAVHHVMVLGQSKCRIIGAACLHVTWVQTGTSRLPPGPLSLSSRFSRSDGFWGRNPACSSCPGAVWTDGSAIWIFSHPFQAVMIQTHIWILSFKTDLTAEKRISFF